MSEKYRKMDETYNEVCQMFGEDGKKIEPSEFFKILHDFVSIYFVSTVNYNYMKSILTAICVQTQAFFRVKVCLHIAINRADFVSW